MRISDWSSDVCSSDLRNVLALGYRGDINHYVGMSHYFRLEALGSGLYVSLTGGTFNAPCAAWHRDFAARAKALGLGVIFSLSYELLNEHCWNDWKQRAENGDPALTGWEPRSEEHTSELQSLMRISYAVFCLTKTNMQHPERHKIAS